MNLQPALARSRSVPGRISRLRILGALLVCLGFAPGLRALTLSDGMGHPLTLKRSPQRIVSLLPSLTETVCALGQCQRLVGVDRYSDYPPEVRRLPVVGGGLDPNIEAIVALHPDLVLAAVSSRSAMRLTAMGIPVLAMEPKSHAEVQRTFTQLGLLLEVADAPRLWRDIEAEVAAAAQTVPPALRGQRVYFEVNRGPYGASEGSFIGETLARLGMKNILPATLGPFPKINPELVVRENPDFIMVGESNVESLDQRPGWSRLSALQNKRVCVFGEAQAIVLGRPGPRLAWSARIMAQCLGALAAKGAEGSP